MTNHFCENFMWNLSLEPWNLYLWKLGTCKSGTVEPWGTWCEVSAGCTPKLYWKNPKLFRAGHSKLGVGCFGCRPFSYSSIHLCRSSVLGMRQGENRESGTFGRKRQLKENNHTLNFKSSQNETNDLCNHSTSVY